MKEQEFIKKFADALDDTDANDLNFNTELKELDEWDSLATLSIISMAQLTYNVKVTGIEINNCDTIEDLYSLIKSKNV